MQESDMIVQMANKKDEDKATLKGVLAIQRMWQRKQKKRAHLNELDVKLKENKDHEAKKTQCVIQIQKRWRQFTKDKKEGKNKGLFDFSGMVKIIHE